ncbi:hypothetical protein ASD18_12340 [Cellulomonas sp. Root137]|nr:hypothetical protein ASD18_12340 [Cellulomonas sp. Root137]
MYSQIPSTAVSASWVMPRASAAPSIALATPTTARTSPPASWRRTDVSTWTTNSPTTTGRAMAAMTATFERNQPTLRSIEVLEFSAASASWLICSAPPTNAPPSPPST